MPSSFVLSTHASYGCRDRGACCTAGWPIPIEREQLHDAQDAVRRGRLASPRGATRLFEHPAHASAEAPALVAVHGDACVFYRGSGARRCEIHRTLGEAALPLACRQFPRVSVHDPRGASITLSHYCPTAADMLDSDARVEVVENAPAFPANAEYVGLDVRGAMPPLLRPDMLMDWDSWWVWERESVAIINDAASPAEALVRLRAAVEQVRPWGPTED